MRIALIANYWLGSQGGGVREYNTHLVRALQSAGHEVQVIFKEGEDASQKKLPYGKWGFSSAALVLLAGFKPDAILTQGGWFCQVPALRYKGRFPNAKIVHFHHSNFPSRLPFHKRWLYDNLMNRYDLNAFVCKALERNIHEVAGLEIRTKKMTAYPGVDYAKPSAEEVATFRRRWSLGDGPVILGQGLTANEGKAKGAALLIESIGLLKRDYPDIKLVLTRTGKFSGRLQEHAKKRLLDNAIVFTGDLANPFIAVESCDVFAHISFADGLPLALLEAMAAGKPIVATNDFGIPEAIVDGESGLLVKNDIEEVVDGIASILSGPATSSRLSENARRQAEEKFRWEIAASTLADSLA